jgi:hypothetical protein
MADFPDEAGYWSITLAEDIKAISKDWQTYSSERGGVLLLLLTWFAVGDRTWMSKTKCLLI